MDCNQAELAMMAHMEKTIHPAQARDLAQHVLNCEACREYFIGFDMALDVLGDAELCEAPADFTQAVMAQVRKLPAHTQPEPAASTSISLRVLWGLSAIVIGVGLLFAFNPEWLTTVTAAAPIVDRMFDASSRLQLFIMGMFDGIAPVYNGAGMFTFNAAIIFAVVVGALLLVLQRSEKSHNS